MLVFFLQVGNFELDLTSYLFYKITSVVSAIPICHMYCRWFADGWLGQGCRVLVVKCAGKVPLPGGGLINFLLALQRRVLVYVWIMKAIIVM